MDRKTLALILTEVVLIVALVVVVAMDFNKKPQAEGVAETQVAEKATKAAPEEGAAEEKAPAAVVAKAEEAVEEKAPEAAEAKAEKAVEAKKPAKEEKPAEKKVAPKPAEKAGAPAKAAAGAPADVIAMNNPAYAKHTKGIVQFTHKKHYTEYKGACGDCHHNEKAEPLTDLKEGDAVQGCIECHPKASKAPAPKKGEKMPDSEKMEYHAEALHANCIDCHKEHNKKNNTKAAPTSCAKCHPKVAKVAS